MKRILYLTFYFEPDLCAGSFRNSPLAKEVSKQLQHTAIVEVISTLPNRYQSFNVEAATEEESGNLLIKRIKLPEHNSGLLDQILAFWKFYRETLKITKNQQYDLVFASSSRLFTAFLGYRIAKQKSIPLILDIRDLFVDTLSDVLQNRILKILLLPILKIIENRVFQYAIHINLISKGFLSYFTKYGNKNISNFTNGIDDEFIFQQDFIEHVPVDVKVITYAGNIGEGQGLHKIIPLVAKLLGNDYRFRIIGDGGAKKLLVDKVNEFGLTNVAIEPPMKRKDLLEVYKTSSFLFLHLNEYDAFEKVLPSKIFELASFPRPIIAGVSGYAQKFIQDNVQNVIIFKPGDAIGLVEKLKKYNYTIINRLAFVNKYRRDRINEQMSKMIISYL